MEKYRSFPTTMKYYSKDDALRLAIYTMLDLIDSQIDSDEYDHVRKAINACEMALHSYK